MKKQPTIAERLKICIANNDIEGIKAIKEEICGDQWLIAWKANGSKMEDWIGPADFDQN